MAGRGIVAVVVSAIGIGVATLACSRRAPAELASNAVASAFVGDAACRDCHAEKVATFSQTAHARTSSWPSAETIHGSFSAGANKLPTTNPALHFVMNQTADGFTQTALEQGAAAPLKSRTEKFGFVVGSGRKGQTFLYWSGENLFQLPVSYWTENHGWINSPGYQDGTANFDRPTPPRCLECHASSFASLAPPENRFDKTSLVPGIGCEKCHGPGGEHVARYRSASPPQNSAASAIVNPARLSRARRIDLCSLCHAGPGQSITPPLSFHPGDRLADHLTFPAPDPRARPDVHASQVQLMERSRCFSSGSMTCSTCHDVHRAQREPESFAARCLTCHTAEKCGEFAQRGHAIDGKCIDCHMPLQKTQQIISRLKGRALQPEVRSHLIGIYPENVP